MIIGVPKERKANESRIALTPDAVSTLTQDGHQVIIETRAGDLSGFTDEEYLDAGATLSPTLEEVWSRAELLVKVKEPAPEEIPLFRKDLAVFCFFHPAAQPTVVRALLEKQVTGLSYDLLLDNNRLPILGAMSIVAGKLAAQCGALSLQSDRGGRGVLMGGTPGVLPAEVLVIGGGVAGSNAAQVAAGMGARVTVMDINSAVLASLARAPFPVRTIHTSPRALSRELTHADLVIGAVLLPGALAPTLITRQMLNGMKPGSVLVDISIDQGGISETSRPTTLASPTYIAEGVVHYCVPNMPSMAARTATEALTIETVKWIRRIAGRGIADSVKESASVRSSLFTHRGHLTNKVVGEALGLPAVEEKTLAGILA